MIKILFAGFGILLGVLALGEPCNGDIASVGGIGIRGWGRRWLRNISVGRQAEVLLPELLVQHPLGNVDGYVVATGLARNGVVLAVEAEAIEPVIALVKAIDKGMLIVAVYWDGLEVLWRQDIERIGILVMLAPV